MFYDRPSRFSMGCPPLIRRLKRYPGFIITLMWMFNLLWFEMLVFDSAVNSAMLSLPSTDNFYRILLIGDPQLTDWYSYSFLAADGPWLPFVEYFSDVFMRKSFRRLMRYHDSFHSVIVTGDVFDGGKGATAAQWNHSLQRYKHIFGDPWPVNMHHVVGNHDVGYPADENRKVVARFESVFGKTNKVVQVGRLHKLLLINSEFLDNSDKSPGRRETLEFITQYNKSNSENKKTYQHLFIHIPLYRRAWRECGNLRHGPALSPHREDFAAKAGKGQLVVMGRQDYLLEVTSKHILSTIKPVLVFSGHDHDFCEYIHTIPGADDTTWPTEDGEGCRAKEWTVGTFSWLQGNLYPSFSVLLLPKNDSVGFVDWGDKVHVFWLPTQLFNYLWYAVAFGCTIIAAAVLCCVPPERVYVAGVLGNPWACAGIYSALVIVVYCTLQWVEWFW
eukprot:TRINITY_DN20973_c0_g1_i1.p1 TRINITY_DN20973_c0_g1~~TRINITY_DN20973_c0_g1_i1.p1  ORF type:complete len:445 (-),score=2.86 TRINITY_DN20973_c0_g1_i1:50-1384(-)